MLFIVRFILEWFSLPALAGLSIICLFRRLYKQFPLFFSYIVAAEFVTISRLVVYAVVTKYEYLDFHNISGTVLSVIALMAVYEVFVKRLFVEFYRVRLYRLLFPAVAIMITMLGVFTLSLYHEQWAVFAVIDRALIFARVAMLVFFVALMLLMGRAWTRYELGIAFGFGALTAPSLFSSAMWTRTQGTWLGYVPLVAWDIACLIWLICFGKRGQAENTAPAEPLNPAMLHEARTWEGVLKGWLTPTKKRR